MANNKPSSVLGLDRKAMEEERLQRMAQKRTSEQAGIMAGAEVPKKAKWQSSALSAVTSIPKDHKRVPVVSQNIAVSPACEKPIETNGNAPLEYPFGTLKRTWAQGPPRKNDIKLEEILQKNTLKTAVFSSWQWDFDWLLPKIDLQRTKCIFVMEAKTEAEKAGWQAQFEDFKNIARVCFPPMRNHLFARMHSKLMLLFHPGHLRLVIPSANPMRHDWGESGLLENMVFVIDLPRLENGRVQGHATAFQRELLRFLDAMGLPEDMREGVYNFDFSKTADLRFIHSIPGSYGADDPLQSGLAGLSEAVRSLKLEATPGQQVEVDYASASVGSLDKTQISLFCASLCGSDPYKFVKTAKTTGIEDKHTANFRLVFPSEKTVQKSKGGTDAAGTIFLLKSTYEKPTFPRDILHDYISTRPGLLSHNKLILVRTAKKAYIYTGSANFSQSAWGRLGVVPKGSREQGKAKLEVTNWECGVLVPVVRGDGEGGGDSDSASGNKSAEVEGVLGYGVLEGVVDVPFVTPPGMYEPGIRPWVRG